MNDVVTDCLTDALTSVLTERLTDHRLPKLSVRESQQKYKDLYGNPDKRPENIILRKNCQLFVAR